LLPQIINMSEPMKRIVTRIALALLAAATPAIGLAATIEGHWKNPKGSVIVHVARCGEAYCGTVSWASTHNRERGATPGTRVLSDLRPLGDGTYKGRAYEPKRDISGSATVRQDGPNVMIVKGCAVLGLICKEQRWTRVS
jgi:uncharacterized protein (DUF2147 family)